MKRSTAIRLLIADLQASRLHWKRKAERLQEQLFDAQLTVGGTSDTLACWRKTVSLARKQMTKEERSRFDTIIATHWGEEI